jgi:hypothetical protein
VKVRRPVLLTLSLPALACTTLTLGEAASPPVDAGALAHCASMTSADERLACYDSLSRPKSKATPAAPTAAAAPGASTAAKSGPQAAAPAATANPAAPGAAAGAAGAAAAGAASAADSKSFGLSRHPPPAEEGPSRIQAKVTRVDADQWGHVRVSLDNGQAWTFDSFNPAVREGEAVTIKRGVAGSFHLTTAEHHTYRAERTR